MKTDMLTLIKSPGNHYYKKDWLICDNYDIGWKDICDGVLNSANTFF